MKRLIIAFVFLSCFCGFGQKPPDETSSSGSFTFKKDVEEVVLHATVLDKKGRAVKDLKKENFLVSEDGVLQPIKSISDADIPVTMCVVIDNSGSMRNKRTAVNTAMTNLIKASNPEDEICWVNFNKEYFLDQDFTPDISLLQEASEKVQFGSGTAFFDAAVASSDHTKKGKRDKKALVIVTDGDDRNSNLTLEETVKDLQGENTPAIYILGLIDESTTRKGRARRNIRVLAETTGGVAYFPKNLAELDNISAEVAHDIRNQYEIVYKPINPDRADKYHTISVEAKAPGYGDLQVRTRKGYYAEKKSDKKPKQ